ncbi:MAG TPA: hypothetical protein VHH13_01170 [Arthrobacter sp.]|nr:hypothetical protein [Arthrobacter sp.]
MSAGSHRCQRVVNNDRPVVKESEGHHQRLTYRRRITAAAAVAAARRWIGGCLLMADLAYALVFIGIFLVLALTLRGLERL